MIGRLYYIDYMQPEWAAISLEYKNLTKHGHGLLCGLDINVVQSCDGEYATHILVF